MKKRKPNLAKRATQLGIVDASRLTDADWRIIEKLHHAHETGGEDGLLTALRALQATDPAALLPALHSFFPKRVERAVLDALAENEEVSDKQLKAMAKRVVALRQR